MKESFLSFPWGHGTLRTPDERGGEERGWRKSLAKTSRPPHVPQWLTSFPYGISFSFLLFFASCSWAAATPASYTFWYGAKPPVDVLSQFDRIIVEADNLSDQDVAALKQHGGKVLAYLSVGEWNSQRATTRAIDPAWVIATNPSWHSKIMDLAAPGWQQFVAHRAAELQARGFQGLFLDTLDSYMLPKMSVAQRTDQQHGLVSMIAQLKASHPEFLLVANRGFEVMAQIAPHLSAVAAESLYQGWDNANQHYRPVSENDRGWLQKTLGTIRAAYGVDIVILDYLPPHERDKARETARKIERAGFIPWISNPSFTYMGIGAVEALPRQVLFLYASRAGDEKLSELIIHRLGAPLFESQGYVPVYVDINLGLPPEILKGRYAGVVSWLDAPLQGNLFSRWLREKIAETIPIALLGDVTVLKDQQLAGVTGVQLGQELDTSRLTVVERSGLIAVAAADLSRIDHIVPLLSSREHHGTTHLRLQDKRGRQADLVVTGDWGGFAASAVVMTGESSWLSDPFAFFQQALQLPPRPAPGRTTNKGAYYSLSPGTMPDS